MGLIVVGQDDKLLVRDAGTRISPSELKAKGYKQVNEDRNVTMLWSSADDLVYIAMRSDSGDKVWWVTHPNNSEE